jgi:hypothetical protein
MARAASMVGRIARRIAGAMLNTRIWYVCEPRNF